MAFAKRLFAILLAAAVTASLISCRKKQPEPEPTPAPTEDANAEFIGHTAAGRVRYWPDGADEDTAEYALFVDYPVFDKTNSAASAINAAMDDYILSLADRVEKDHVPTADGKSYSKATFEVGFARGYLNVIFHVKHGEIAETDALMFDRRGDKMTVFDIFLSYNANIMAANAICLKMEDDPLLPSPDPNVILGEVDREYRVSATDTGCTVWFPPDSVEQGEHAFELSFEDVLGSLVSPEGAFAGFDEYASAQELIRMALLSVIIHAETVENGVLSPYAAGVFMTQAAAGVPSTAGRRIMPKDEFESLYRSCFGEDYPGCDPDSDSVRMEDGVYSISVSAPSFVYNVEPNSVVSDGDTVVITGDLMTGTFGERWSEFVCPVTVTLQRNAESPYGFVLRELIPHYV